MVGGGVWVLAAEALRVKATLLLVESTAPEELIVATASAYVPGTGVHVCDGRPGLVDVYAFQEPAVLNERLVAVPETSMPATGAVCPDGVSSTASFAVKPVPMMPTV